MITLMKTHPYRAMVLMAIAIIVALYIVLHPSPVQSAMLLRFQPPYNTKIIDAKPAEVASTTAKKLDAKPTFRVTR